MCENNWYYLPTTVLLKIFGYLNYNEILRTGPVCKRWYEISKDELLWKELFYAHFKVDRTITLQGKFFCNYTYFDSCDICMSPLSVGNSWYSEFKRLCYRIPIVLTETLTEHANQVLHVSFSHNGKYFATCSKDGYIFVSSN